RRQDLPRQDERERGRSEAHHARLLGHFAARQGRGLGSRAGYVDRPGRSGDRSEISADTGGGYKAGSGAGEETLISRPLPTTQADRPRRNDADDFYFHCRGADVAPTGEGSVGGAGSAGCSGGVGSDV